MSCIARTVSSIGVSGSARWQNTRSTCSSLRRARAPSIACIRYLRLRVFFSFGPSWSPQYSLVDTR